MIHPLALVGEPPQMRGWLAEQTAYPPEIHPSARIEALCTIDAGVERPTRIGARSWLLKVVHVGHDAQIGEDCEIAPLTSIGGYVEIGDRVKVGQGATFKPYVKVGNDARIGMGAAVIRDVPAGETHVGVPARKMT